MKKLVISSLAFIVSCTSAPTQKPSDNTQNSVVLISDNQGGSEYANYQIIKNEQEFQQAIKKNWTVQDMNGNPSLPAQLPKFPADKKVVLYNQGTFTSGVPKITKLKSAIVKNNVLYIEVPEYKTGGIGLSVMSYPWFIFSVPSNYNFTSVELKYSK